MNNLVKLNVLYMLIAASLLMNAHSFNQLSSQLKPLEKNGTTFVLITMLYNEKNSSRTTEYLACLERNMIHSLIETVHVLYDSSADDGESFIKTKIDEYQLPITYITRRGTYQDCFDIASKYYPNKIIIIANADIYFNHTLYSLINYDFTNKFLAITRWDELADGTLKLFGHHVSDTQDAWIFKMPLPIFTQKNIEMGILDCDGRIAFRARQAGLQVINPCKTIQCCHVHLSNIRNYGPRKNLYPWHEAMLIPWSDLM